MLDDPAPNEKEVINGATEALRIAHASFFLGLDFDEDFPSHAGTGVSFDAENGRSTLSVNFKNPIANSMRTIVGNWTEAWILILAHESGHLQLNAICKANGEDPSDPNAQLRAMGIDPDSEAYRGVIDFQKETAIEAFCDACLAMAAKNFLGPNWKASIELLREQRASKSKALGFFEDDEYATQSGLDAFLGKDGEEAPQEIAKIALKESIRTTSILKKTAVSTANWISNATENVSCRLSTWRESRKARKPTTGSGKPPTPY